jgi:hypothetical protein
MSVDTPNASGSASPDDTTPDTLTLKVDTSGLVTVVGQCSQKTLEKHSASVSQMLMELIDKHSSSAHVSVHIT